jgi:hypothetical protein
MEFGFRMGSVREKLLTKETSERRYWRFYSYFHSYTRVLKVGRSEKMPVFTGVL